ncbi:MAG: hypothetical protein AAB801_03280 [Patescibacteria group bacterium]
MDAMLKECMKPHSLAHFVSGAGIALLVLYFVPALSAYLLWGGVVLLVLGFVWDWMVNPAKKG